jgi:hypothetical protein
MTLVPRPPTPMQPMFIWSFEPTDIAKHIMAERRRSRPPPGPSSGQNRVVSIFSAINIPSSGKG